MNESPIECSQLTKKYRRTPVLDSLDLAVPAGSIYALIGPNGAGKTTLIKTLVNILRPTFGTSSVLGVPSSRLSPKEFAQIGYVSKIRTCPSG